MFGEKEMSYKAEFNGENAVNMEKVKDTAEYCRYCVKEANRRQYIKGETTTRIKERRKKEMDEGKIKALKRAGWKEADIAGDMGLDLEEVQKVLRRKMERQSNLI